MTTIARARRFPLWSVMTLLGVASIALQASPSHACSFSEIGFEDMQLSVADGDVVPVNVVIFGAFTGPDGGLRHWLVAPDGTATRLEGEIRADLQMTRFVPAEPLSADTTYRLVTAGATPPTGEFPVRLSFTTRADDDVAPAAPVVAFETKEIFPDPFNSCGPVDGETWARFFVEPGEPGSIAMYRLVGSDGDLDDVRLAPFITRDDDGNIFLSVTEPQGGFDSYSVIATNHAGIDSLPTRVDAWLGCPGSCGAGDMSAGTLGALLLLARRRGQRGRRAPTGHLPAPPSR